MWHDIVRLKQRLMAGVVHAARTKYAVWLLGTLSFLNSFVPTPPPDVLFIPMILAHRARWFFYATVTTLTSLLGAVVAYIIGAGLFQVLGAKLISSFGLQADFIMVGEKFSQHLFGTIFMIALTPIPDTVFTIGAGLLKVNFFVFFVAYLLGRILRIYPECFLVAYFGERAARVAEKYINIVSFGLVVILILILILL